MYSWSPNLSQISLKNSFGKVVFQILTEIEMTRNQNRLLAAILKLYKYFIFFSWSMVVISVYIYGVKIILKKSGVKMVFSGGSMEPPYALMEVRGIPCAVKC